MIRRTVLAHTSTWRAVKKRKRKSLPKKVSAIDFLLIQRNENSITVAAATRNPQRKKKLNSYT